MKKICCAMISLAFIAATGPAHGQERVQPKRMMLIEAFDAGQPNAVILKLFDPAAEVYCYVLMPEKAARKQVEGGWVFEGNSVGSISCVDRRTMPTRVVVEAAPSHGAAAPPRDDERTGAKPKSVEAKVPKTANPPAKVN